MYPLCAPYPSLRRPSCHNVCPLPKLIQWPSPLQWLKDLPFPASTQQAFQLPGPPPESTSGPGPSRRPAPNSAAKRDPPKVRKILSLDGGGVRGLSIITILKYVMQEVNRERGTESTPLDPWQEFDMIGGTNTGGILAIMLGRLRMTLDECESAYTSLAETIFTPVHYSANPVRFYKFLNAKGKFSSTPLEDCIRSTIASKDMSEHAPLKDQDPDTCRVFVCATRAEGHSLAILRSYKTRRHDPLFDICKIWEAARATSAASTFFEPIEIGPSRQKFVDGALTGRSNPIRTANTESRDVWPGEERLILSIGTGAAPGQAVTGNLISLVERLKEIVTDSEQTNRDFRMENNDMIRNGRLYRFNVLHGLADVGLEEHQAISRIAACTDRYLDDPDVFDMVQDCVSNITSGVQRLGIRPEEEFDEAFSAMTFSDAFVVICADCFEGLRADSITYFCIGCEANFCSNCQSSHALSHADQLVRWTNQFCGSSMANTGEFASCTECSLDVKGRIECSFCTRAICRACHAPTDRRIAWYNEHRAHAKGTGFLDLVAATYSVVSPTDHQCDCYRATGCVSHCERCFQPNKLGETVHRCQTCYIEYHNAQELCENCNLQVADTHKGHDIKHLTLQRVDDMPDDQASQAESWWRCAFPGCGHITGPHRDWQHKHSHTVLCIGGALANYQRKTVPLECTKTVMARLRLKNPPNPSNMSCDICLKAIGYDIWNLWCTVCDSFTCKTCIDTGRAGHRHAMNWTRTLKLGFQEPFVYGAYHTCDCCQGQNFSHLFTGFECTICRNYQCCLSCVTKGVRPQHPVCGGKPATFDFKLR